MMVKTPRGFIAVLLIVTLGALLALTTLAAVRITVGRTILEIDMLASERAFAITESCVEEGLMRLALNPSYSGNETITIAALPCTLGVVTILPSGNRILPASSTVDGRTRAVLVEFTPSPLHVVSWREEP